MVAVQQVTHRLKLTDQTLRAVTQERPVRVSLGGAPGPRGFNGPDLIELAGAEGTGLIGHDPGPSFDPWELRAYLNLSRNWLNWASQDQRDLALNADPGDEPNLTAVLQAALSSGEKTIVAPRRAARAKIDKLMIPQASYGRTLDFGEMELTQRVPQTGTQLNSGLLYPTYTGSPDYGGHDNIRIIGGKIVQTSRVHDALVKMLHFRNARVEGMVVKPRAGRWTPVTANAATDTFTAAGHGFVDGDYVAVHTINGTRPGGLLTRSYTIINATADTFQIVLGLGDTTPVDFTSNGSNVVVAYYGAWAFKLGGEDSVWDGLRIEGEDLVVYQDGFHFVHGRRCQLTNLVGHSGDDLFVIGQEFVHTDTAEREISEILMQGSGVSHMGHLARVYTSEASQTVKDVELDVKGIGGRLRNGVVKIEGVPSADVRTSTPLVDKVRVNVQARFAEATHQGVNCEAIHVAAAANVKISGEIESAGYTTANAGTIFRSTVDISDLKLKVTGGPLAIERSDVIADHFELTGCSADFITVKGANLRMHGSHKLLDLANGAAAIKLVADSGMISVVDVEGGVASHVTGATSGSVVDFSASVFGDTLRVKGMNLRRARGHFSRGSGNVLIGENIVENAVRNPDAAGAATGSPGTLPTGWVGFTTITTAANPVSGLNGSVIAGFGRIEGRRPAGFRLAGTTSGTAGAAILPMNIGDMPATNGQKWRAEWSLRLLAGSLTNITSVRLRITARSAAGTALVTDHMMISLTDFLQEFSHEYTLAHASTGRVTMDVFFEMGDGVVVDVSLLTLNPKLYRIG